MKAEVEATGAYAWLVQLIEPLAHRVPLSQPKQPRVIVPALRKYPSPPVPGPHSRQHVPLARLAAIDMALTAITGWVFYWLAFVD
jgi:hypothetical protein